MSLGDSDKKVKLKLVLSMPNLKILLDSMGLLNIIKKLVYTGFKYSLKLNRGI